jgi:hypothetical protein
MSSLICSLYGNTSRFITINFNIRKGDKKAPQSQLLQSCQSKRDNMMEELIK